MDTNETERILFPSPLLYHLHQSTIIENLLQFSIQFLHNQTDRRERESENGFIAMGGKTICVPRRVILIHEF